MLRNFLFSVVFFSGIILISIIFLPSLILPRHIVIFGGKIMGHWASFCLRAILSVKIEIIGKENAAFGVNSGSIRMGYFDGRMTNMMSEDKIKGFKMSVGNRKLGTSENLTKAIDFMIENNYTNGGTIELTGGISYN